MKNRIKIIGILVAVFALVSCGIESNDSVEDEIVSQVSDELFILDEPLAVPQDMRPEISEMGFTTNFDVYISDPGEAFTNVRKTAGGEVILELPHSELEQEYMLTIIEVKNGWFKFRSPVLSLEEDVKVPGGHGWVHHSVVATDTRNYGGQTISLYESANESSKVTGTIDLESGGLKILDAISEWVLIELTYDDYYRKGWMKAEWCCGNPLTNCS